MVKALERRLKEGGLSRLEQLKLKRELFFAEQALKAQERTEAGLSAASIDLKIVVKVDQSDHSKRLMYEVHSPNGRIGVRHEKVTGPPLVGDLRPHLKLLAEKVERLQRGLDVDGSQLCSGEIQEKFKSIGRELYAQLFPADMKQLYRAFRMAKSVQICSEEPWIPWEMIKPFDATDPGDLIDDDFFGGRFRLTRWFQDWQAPVEEFQLARVCYLDASRVPELPSLEYGAQESSVFQDAFSKCTDVTALTGDQLTAPSIKSLLGQRSCQVIHFSGHGDFHPESPVESGVKLPNGRTFRCIDLHGEALTRISVSRPLIFFNVCRAGQLGLSLTGLGGWAERWIKQYDCGAFIGPQWAVRDQLAFEFSRTFYEGLRDGASLGEASFQARDRLRSLDPADASWLAFVIYAHPNGRLIF